MMNPNTRDSLFDLVPDEDVWDAPDWLSDDQCLEELGTDWRRTPTHNPFGEEES